MKTPLIIICIIFLTFVQSKAQNQCVQSLDKARALFSNGHLYAVPDVLEECLANGFTREQRIQAYHLLTMTYLYLDQHKKAEDNYMHLLQLDPEFDVEKDNDKIEIVYLNRKFRTTPIFTFRARAGLNSTSPVIINDYDINQKDPEEYARRTGYHFGPGIDLHIGSSVKLGVEVLYRRTLFNYNTLRFNEDNLNVTQIQNWLSIPYSLKYSHKIDKYHPYIYAGYMLDYLISSRGDFAYTNYTQEQGILQVENPNINMRPLRNSFSSSVFGGIGVKKRIGYYFVFAEVRYVWGLKNIVNIESRYPQGDGYLYDFEALYQFSYIDDDMRLNSASFSVGFEKPFYKPRKITTEKGFLKRIFK